MPCQTQRTSEKRRRKIILCQRVGENLCAEAQLGGTSCTKEETSNTVYAQKIGVYESRRCRVNEIGTQKHEEHIADRGHSEFFESLNYGSSADAYSKSNDKSGREGGSGQGMGQISKIASLVSIPSEKFLRKHKHNAKQFIL